MTKKRWTNKEILIIKSQYSILGARQIKNLLPNRTLKSIRHKAKQLKVEYSYWDTRQDISHFINPQDPFICYFLGFLWADGHIRKNNRYEISMTIVSKDFKDIKKYCHLLGKEWKYFEFQPKQSWHKKASKIYISHKNLHAFLKENDYNIKSGASADKILSKIPENLRHYWWRGYFDGDGWFGNINKRQAFYTFYFSSCYNQNWHFVENLMAQLDIKNYKISKNILTTGRNSIIGCANYDGIIKFGNYIYQGEQFGLKRKKNKFFNLIKEKAKNLGISKFVGVSKVTRKVKSPYTAYINLNKKHYHIGSFLTEEEAAKARDKKAKELLGDKAILNFPIDEID